MYIYIYMTTPKASMQSVLGKRESRREKDECRVRVLLSLQQHLFQTAKNTLLLCV